MSSEQGSSLFWTTVNFSKLCIGSGVLALPFAASKGGLLLTPLGLAGVAAWNVLSCKMMMDCKYACTDKVYPPEMTSTYTKIAYSGLGKIGALVTAFCVIICLMGVCICYEISFALMMTGLPDTLNPLSNMPLETQTGIYIYLSAAIVYPIACAKSVQFLSPVSFMALLCLCVGLIVLVVYGYINVYTIDETTANVGTDLVYWPEQISDATSYMGIALYCYGLCVICFPIEESMANKNDFFKALTYCCIFVTVFYSVVGDLLSSIYRFSANGVEQNILQNLPDQSHAATVVRIVMAVVCLLSFPLTFLPPAQIIEQQFWNTRSRIMCWSRSGSGTDRFPYEPISHTSDGISSNALVAYEEPSLIFRSSMRFLLVLSCSLLAAHVPCFGMVISLLGSIGVTILSFVLPPLLHAILITSPRKIPFREFSNRSDLPYYVDVCLTLVGTALCLGCTYYTIHGAYERYLHGEMC